MAEPGTTPFEPRFFETPDEIRDWLDANHATAAELFVGGWRKDTGRPSITWEQLVDEALCVGWIDGIRRSLPDGAWSQRITPRRKGSNWSSVNVANVERLRAAGRMHPAGEAAFALRRPERTGIYSYEQRHEARLAPEEEAEFRAKGGAAWTWWEAQSRAFRAIATYWVVSAKRPETRARRLAQLIEDATAGRKPERFQPLARRAADPSRSP
ncbi:MAG TPA: YdeI/OmpD-associated family protein [Candidatus Limnocylindrales bacterium]|nr:YdeI/OmpD-associated family protein [Candidatus Limnocylindrales bacterium]